MKNFFSKSSTLLVIFILLGTFSVKAQTHITTPAELDAMRDNASESYVLDNHIDLSGFSWIPFEFLGTLDGNGFSIKNLNVDKDGNNAGLFSSMDGATVQNLGIENVIINCTGNGGALSGIANASTVTRCFATGEVNSNGVSGGLIGNATEIILSESYTDITVNGNDRVGGLIGNVHGGSITNCYSNATVFSANFQAGGLVGWAQSGAVTSITKSFAKGTARAVKGYTGGILAVAQGPSKLTDITDCISLQSALTTDEAAQGRTFRIVANHGGATYSNNFGLETTVLTDPIRTQWTNSLGDKDGESITMEQVSSLQFFADRLVSWDFENTWVMTSEGPELAWVSSTPTSVNNPIQSNTIVYAKDGEIYVVGADEKSEIKVFNVTGQLLHQKSNVSAHESFDVQNGAFIVLIQSPQSRNVYKVINSLR